MRMTGFRALAALLCLCILLPMTAMASPGDASLTMFNYYDGDGDYISAGLLLGSTVVLIGDKAVYTWNVGDADKKAYPWDIDRNARYREILDEVSADIDLTTTNVDANELARFSDGEALYAVLGINAYHFGTDESSSEFLQANLARLVLDENGAHYEMVEDGELDWSALINTYYGGESEDIENSYPASLNECIYLDGCLYSTTWVDDDIHLIQVPVDGGYSNVLDDLGSIEDICAYKDGKLLLMSSEYQDMGAITHFSVFDPETEECTELLDFSQKDGYLNLTGVVYSEENDCLYSPLNGALHAINLTDGSVTEVNDLPPSHYAENASMIPGGYYASASVEGLIVRNVDPSVRPQRHLNILSQGYVDNINAAYNAFTNAHGDVSVVVRDNYSVTPQSIIEGMMNHSNEYDIFLMSVGNSAYTALLERGYMADLSDSSALVEAYNLLYPNLRPAFAYNDKPVAIPLSADASCMSVYNDAMEKAGLTMEDIPDNWLDFINAIEPLHERCSEKGVALFAAYMSQQEVKQQLFSKILDDYFTYIVNSSDKVRFNTPELISVLEALEKVDFAKLGLPEEYSEDYWRYNAAETILFEMYNSCTINYFPSNYTPMLLSINKDMPTYIGVNTNVLFINPYSANQDIAREFIETTLQNTDDGVLANLMDIDVEPRRNSYYEEYIQSQEEYLETLRQNMAELPESEQQALQEEIKMQEEYLEDRKENDWRISPKGIEWVKGNKDKFVIGNNGIYSMLYSSENSEDVSDIFTMYYDGKIDSVELIKRLDEKLSMMLLEGN